MKRFQVAAFYEEGFSVIVEADSEAEATAKVLEPMCDEAGISLGDYVVATVHRDCAIVSVEEIVE